MKKSWTEKLNDPSEPELKRATSSFAGIKEGQMMLLPTAKLVQAYVDRIRPDETMSVTELRDTMAKDWKADITCPIVTGFALRTLVEATFEQAASAADQQPGESLASATPIWRIVDRKTTTWKKLAEHQRDTLMALRIAEQASI